MYRLHQALLNTKAPWYLKALDAAGTFVGEVSGYYDYKRAADGVDPVTGEKLTDGQRVAAGGMAAAGYIPIIGWAGKLAKGGNHRLRALIKHDLGYLGAAHPKSYSRTYLGR